MASEQCKHVFLAAAGSSRYHQVLEPYRKQISKITPIFGSGLDGKLRQLGLHLVSFPSVFVAPPGIKTQSSSNISGGTREEAREIKTDTVRASIM